MKTCTKCGETKPFSEYSKCSSKRSGLQSQCKSCCNAKSSAWRKNHPNILAYNTKAQSAYRAANPDKVKSYRAANAEKRNAQYAKWAAANPEAVRVIKQNRRARKLENGGRLSKGVAEKLYSLQRGKCACGCKQPLGDDYHLDHIMPIALGGTNTDDNIQLLRAKCNLQKNAKHPVDFMQQRGFLL